MSPPAHAKVVQPRTAGTPPGRFVVLTSPRGMVVWATLAALFVLVTSSIYDPDFWWHLKAGQIILQTHSLIATDPFTYTATGHHWTMHEWLSEVIFAALHAAGGLALIVAVFSIITWLGILCIFVRARLDTPNVYVLAVGMLLGGMAGYPIWGPRTQMITFALSCALLLMVERHQRSGSRAIWWLVPLFVLWSNVHSGFLAGIGFLVVVAVADLAGYRLGWPGSAPPRRSGTLLLVAMACTLAAMINPNGPGIVLYPFATVGSPAQSAGIQEWMSPNFHLWEVALLYAPMLLSLALAAAVNRSMRARDAALAVAGVALSLQSVRNIALFVAAATPVWITQVDGIAERWRNRRPRPQRPAPIPPALLRVPAAGVVALTLLLSIVIHGGLALAVREDSLTYAKDYPVCAVRWLMTAQPGLKIFNQYGEGGYLAYKLSERGDRVFIFGDAALMGDQMLLTYNSVIEPHWDWETILASYHTDVVLFDTNTPLDELLRADSAEWTRVYADNRNEAFVRNDALATLHLPAQTPVPGNPNDTCAQLQAAPPSSGP